MKTTIKVANTEGFFKRGKEVVKLADQGKRIPRERIISFENPEDLARLITTAKLMLFCEVKECPGSITDLSQRLSSRSQRGQTGC
jgi:predicted transcriptional regulator